MAKKNKASLMSGIMGDVKPQTPEVSSVTTQEVPVSEITDEMKDNLEAKRRRNVGRPRKGETGKQTNEVRATFIVDPEIVRKLKYVSLAEGTLLKDVIAEALNSYLESWESENGKIWLPKVKSLAQ